MRNVGTVDRTMRVVVGVIALSLLFVLDGGIKYVGLLGVPILLTGIAGACLMYKVFGISTCKR